MKVFKIAVIFFVVFVVVLLIITVSLPSESVIRRNIFINTPAKIPFGIVMDLKQWKDWFPIFAMDHSTKFIYEGKDSLLPYFMKWKSENPGVGEGKLKMRMSRQFKRIKVIITLQNEKEGILDFLFVENHNSTKLILEFHSELTFFEKWMGFMIDSIIGPTLESSLDRIKTISEYINFKKEDKDKQ
ncbi:MAG: hypothetical protein V1779_04225 [bacterium]